MLTALARFSRERARAPRSANCSLNTEKCCHLHGRFYARINLATDPEFDQSAAALWERLARGGAGPPHRTFD
jgi:hypothetical protein